MLHLVLFQVWFYMVLQHGVWKSISWGTVQFIVIEHLLSALRGVNTQSGEPLVWNMAEVKPMPSKALSCETLQLGLNRINSHYGHLCKEELDASMANELAEPGLYFYHVG